MTKMEVQLMGYIPNSEEICAKAMRGCRTKEAAFELVLEKPADYYIDLAIKIGHEGVIEHSVFVFSVKNVSRALTHQLVRHRIASYSQQSQRAVDPTEPVGKWYIIPESIKKDKDVLGRYIRTMSNLWYFYGYLLRKGIPKEDARFTLPNATRTNIVITMNARELRHFFKLRLSKTAQWEIREMAQKMLKLVKGIAPTIFSDIDDGDKNG